MDNENTETIILRKELPSGNDSKTYICNLETVVNDLYSRPFKKMYISIYDEYDNKTNKYDANISYGEVIEKNKSGVPCKRYESEYNVDISSLRKIRKRIRKTIKIYDKLINPDFKIEFKIKDIHKNNRIYRLDLLEFGYSTDIKITLSDSLAEIKINYDKRSNKKEFKKIRKATDVLEKRGYKVNYASTQPFIIKKNDDDKAVYV